MGLSRGSPGGRPGDGRRLLRRGNRSPICTVVRKPRLPLAPPGRVVAVPRGRDGSPPAAAALPPRAGLGRPGAGAVGRRPRPPVPPSPGALREAAAPPRPRSAPRWKPSQGCGWGRRGQAEQLSPPPLLAAPQAPPAPSMSEGPMSRAATMEIPIHGNGDSRRLADDDGLEQDLQQVMVSGPNLNETSIVSGGYGGTTEGIVPTSIIKGQHLQGLMGGGCLGHCTAFSAWWLRPLGSPLCRQPCLSPPHRAPLRQEGGGRLGGPLSLSHCSFGMPPPILLLLLLSLPICHAHRPPPCVLSPPPVRLPSISGPLVPSHPPRGPLISPNPSAASRIASQAPMATGSNLHQPHPNPAMTGEEVAAAAATRGVAVEKLDIVRKWGINTYKCTKQLLSERFGRGSRTVDLELETQIELLRDTKRKYESLLGLARALTNHFYSLVQTQHALADAFSDLSQKSPELQEEFGYNAETQKLLCKNGETLLGAVNFFVSSINTLVNKTMEDTLMTVKQYETARLEYDAYRTDLEELNLGPRDASTLCRLDAAQANFHAHRAKYEKLRADVAVKLKFLEENKVKVMHKQLLLFHNAISAYFAGNQQQLEQTLKQFNIKLKSPGTDKPSWLEEQ